MGERALQLLIVKDSTILAQKFFKRKRKIEKIRYEFSGGAASALVFSYVPKENSIVVFIEQALKDKDKT